MALKITEMSVWFGSVPRDAWLEIAVEGSANLTRRIQVSDILEAGSRVVRVEDDHVLAPGDAGAYLRFDLDGSKILFIDDEASMGSALPADAEIEGRNAGTGDLVLTISSSNVFVYPPLGGSLIVPSGGDFRLKRIAANEYDLRGDTEPAS